MTKGKQRKRGGELKRMGERERERVRKEGREKMTCKGGGVR